MDEQTAVTVVELNPAAEIDHASGAAAACKAIVAASAQTIQGRKYVRVEGWQAIAVAHGCVASARDVQRVESGYRAVGEIRRRDTGAVIAEAEGFVGDDEQLWAKRPEFARRAMAQTRAISRACRSAFAHIIVMMNAGLETTPAEEMESAIHQQATAPVRPIAAPQRASHQPTGHNGGGNLAEAVGEIRMILDREYGEAAEHVMSDFSSFTGKDGKERRLHSWAELEHASDKWVHGILRKVREQFAESAEPGADG